MEDKTFYRVLSTLDRAPLREYLMNGYMTRREFERALRQLLSRWKGRVGERIDNRHDFLLLRFHDTPGGKPDEAWLPRYLLEPVEHMEQPSDSSDKATEELNAIYGFD